MWQETESKDSLVWVGKEGGGYTIPLRSAMHEIKKARYRHDIQEAADQAGIIFKVRRELRLLESHLADDERVLALVPATHRDERGLLVATTERVLFVFHGWVNKTLIAMDYPTVTNMRWLGGFILGRMRLYVYGSDSSNKFTQVWNPAGKNFVKVVNARTSNISNMSRDNYEVRRLVSNIPRRVYQIKPNDLIADKLRALDEKFTAGMVPEKDYLDEKLALLKEMD